MFRNVGEKLKVVAIISLIIGIIASVIIGIAEIIVLQFIVGIIIIALGILSSLIPAWVLYAIGEIAENTEAILAKLGTINSNNENNTKIKPVGKYADSKDDTWICSCGAKNSCQSSTCLTCLKLRQR